MLKQQDGHTSSSHHKKLQAKGDDTQHVDETKTGMQYYYIPCSSSQFSYVMTGKQMRQDKCFYHTSRAQRNNLAMYIKRFRCNCWNLRVLQSLWNLQYETSTVHNLLMISRECKSWLASFCFVEVFKRCVNALNSRVKKRSREPSIRCRLLRLMNNWLCVY